MQRFITKEEKALRMYKIFGVHMMYPIGIRDDYMTSNNHAVKILNKKFGVDFKEVLLYNYVTSTVDLSGKPAPNYFIWHFIDHTSMWCTRDEYPIINQYMQNTTTGKCFIRYQVTKEESTLSIYFK